MSAGVKKLGQISKLMLARLETQGLLDSTKGGAYAPQKFKNVHH